ncbi:nitroreductase family deazaflavin-dependent oxidoreductase [Agromyces seonyuensis]|uniref:Nitroreductase family deazaflavin-dependent oxidoreductase n=1 Tax=Agromyces seonyuensis TaxID=2662446 RepID=A0A6I4P5A4_9MICO|nr:nitroreductase family deazaflavin-dependent oxidoreductase [Agromyces seonyuensis]
MAEDTGALRARSEAFRATATYRFLNRGVAKFARAGLFPATVLLTTRGRKSGQPRSLPATPIEVGGRHWLVAPYGVVDWVRNVRAHPEVTLARGRTRRRFTVREVGAEEAGPVLRRYAQVASVARPSFDAGPDDPPEAFAAEADRHPVFELLDA